MRARCSHAIGEGRRDGAALVVTPELSLCGYPPEDLLLRPAFLDACATELAALAARSARARRRIVGFPRARCGGRATTPLPCCATAASRPSIASSTCPTTRCSTRTATSSRAREPVRLRRRRRALRHRDLRGLLVRRAGAAVARGRRASSSSCRTARRITRCSRRARVAQVEARVARRGLPFVYVNRVGGQDELVFDGASFVDGRRRRRSRSSCPRGTRRIAIARFRRRRAATAFAARSTTRSSRTSTQALVMGVRDYVGKNRFPGVLLGLSGGVDSALTLAVAVDALGADRVRAVMMPSQYSASISLEDARDMAAIARRALRRDRDRADVRRIPRRARRRVRGPAAGRHRGKHPGAHPRHAADGAVEQVRLDRADDRQQVARWPSATATLYGDMAGGFAVLKDISKTLVYRLVPLPQQPRPR